MARANLLYELIKYALINDNNNLRKIIEAICAEERSKNHIILANKIEELLKKNYDTNSNNKLNSNSWVKNGVNEQELFWEITPKRNLADLILPENVINLCEGVIEEQMRSDLLRSYGVEPRNKILLIGPPGNGKTSLAEAIAESLMLPLLTVRYESIIGTYLGETANRLSKLMQYVKTRPGVLFFDKFETLGKERGDVHETGEIKRVVSSLLLQIDSLPSYVVAIAATNHETLLDKAAWRRFQIKLTIPLPTRLNIEKWFDLFKEKRDFDFGLASSTLAKKVYGYSYAEVEEFAMEIYRQYILSLPNTNTKEISNKVHSLWKSQVKAKA